MSDIKKISAPLSDADVQNLKAGDTVSISGIIYTGRDKAHALLLEALEQGEALPVDMTGQIIYYAGPTPSKPGQAIGSVGPTTSSRMDAFSPQLLAEAGLKGMLGKGPRNQEVIDAMIENKAVYLVAVGGTGAAIANAVKKADVVAYDELGTEAIRRLEVAGLAAIVAIDSEGGNLFESGRASYALKLDS